MPRKYNALKLTVENFNHGLIQVSINKYLARQPGIQISQTRFGDSCSFISFHGVRISLKTAYLYKAGCAASLAATFTKGFQVDVIVQ
jgi:hypothetical protein